MGEADPNSFNPGVINMLTRRSMLSALAAVPVVALTTHAVEAASKPDAFLGARCKTGERIDCVFAPEQDPAPPTYEEFNEFPGRWAFHSKRSRDEATLKYTYEAVRGLNGKARLQRAFDMAFGEGEGDPFTDITEYECTGYDASGSVTLYDAARFITVKNDPEKVALTDPLPSLDDLYMRILATTTSEAGAWGSVRVSRAAPLFITYCAPGVYT